TRIAAKGKISSFRGIRQMNAPMVDVISEANEVVRIVPQYPATADISTVWLRRIIRNALDAFCPVADPLPVEVRRRHRLMERTEALSGYHFPAEMSERDEARRRLVFDELFTLQTGLAFHKRRIERQEEGIAHQMDGKLAGAFLDSLPFRLTEAQRTAVAEIGRDLAKTSPMHRLLQGDRSEERRVG